MTSALAGFVSLPYFFMGMHDLIDEPRGQLQSDIPKWDPYLGVGFMALLSFGAFFMAYRFLRYAFLIKPKD